MWQWHNNAIVITQGGDNLIKGVTEGDISSIYAKWKFQEYQDEKGNH